MTERAGDPQSEALRAFLLLASLRADWRGALVIACGLGPAGEALSVAANIAGAGCLVIDERAEVCRAALRSGACDFVVNTVDEALRVLKNEIRQRRPVSVGLTLGWTAALEELAGRGVLPELFTAFRGAALRGDEDLSVSVAAAWEFASLGAQVVDFDGSLQRVPDSIDATKRLEEFTGVRGLRFEAFRLESAEELRVLGHRLQTIIPAGDPRQRWSAGAPRFFHRERPYRRVAFLTAEELVQLGGPAA